MTKPINELSDIELREAVAVEVCCLRIEKIVNDDSVHAGELVHLWESDGTWCRDYLGDGGLVIERDDLMVRDEVPHFEDNAIAALMVVSAMNERGFTFSHEQWPDYENWGASFCKDGDKAHTRDGSFPRAICIAAPTAIRARKA